MNPLRGSDQPQAANTGACGRATAARGDRAAGAGAMPPTPSGAAQPAEFLNRDLSWLEFNRRVLHEALDERTPLLERLKFLASSPRTSTSSS